MTLKKYLLVPIPESPYYRIGPEKWQDWYRQIKRTITITQTLSNNRNEIIILILSSFQAKGKPSEIELYTKAFNTLAPGLNIHSYRETYETLEQIERSFEISKELGADLIFISTWMKFPRTVYLARGRKAKHYGTFGIPSPIFAFINPLSMILQPIIILLGLGKFFQRITTRRREKGTAW
jgi:CRISPR/Cas system CSM-associated protein Csm2 small subunit